MRMTGSGGAVRPPLADRMRPQILDQVRGQEHLTAPGRLLFQALQSDRLPSLIFWGPPGCGKTTLARIIAAQTRNLFESMSAVMVGVREVRQVVDRAREEKQRSGRATILFMDEIHRFNKGQQDAFLPFVEDGTIILLGATTENPSFELNGALLSRTRVVTLNPLDRDVLTGIIEEALKDEARGLGNRGISLADGVAQRIAETADGDARLALNLLETLVELHRVRDGEPVHLGLDELNAAVAHGTLRHDKSGEAHYNLISALHKSLRGSDVDASLYWLARMLVAGEDGLYVARRLIRFASEDVGNADPQALLITLAAKDAYHFMGRPEGELALAQAVIYLATSPKSNSVYTAYETAKEVAVKKGSLPPPLHLRNAPTQLMKQMGYGRGYQYAHDYEHALVLQEHLPDSLIGHTFYVPVERGYEREIAKRLEYWKKLKKRRQADI
ncbi:MAG: replication-associated recombination protein A [Magnetococcales bacterium]|nr:replication-associated recombination protein A [Magnetococcales bacterium]MBF0632328.1 replication-associated recombination protein A [Magnetococcales bacterium]